MTMDKKTILIVMQHFHPVKLGAYTRLYNFISKSSQFKFILPTVHEKIGSMPELPSNIELVYIHPKPDHHRQFIFYLWTYIKIIFLRRKEIILCYCVSPPAYFSLIGLLFKILFRLPYIIDTGDPWVNNALASGQLQPNPFIIWIPRMIEYLVFIYADKCFMTSPQLIPQLPSHQCKSETLMTGIDPQLFKPNGKLKCTSRFTIVYAGSIGPLQDLEKFLYAFSRLVSYYPDCELKLVGMDVMDTLKKLKYTISDLKLEDYIQWEGLVGYSDIPSYLHSSDMGLVILKNNDLLNYALPTKLFEYCMAGLPVIAIGGKALKDFMEESQAGIYIESYKNPDEIAEVLMKEINNPRLKYYSSNGRLYAEIYLDANDYSRNIEIMIDQFTHGENYVNQSFFSLCQYWLFETDIHEKNRSTPYYGSFSHSYDIALKNYKWIYNEITAYSIPLLLYLYKKKQNTKYLHWALSSGNYLLTQQSLLRESFEYGSFPFGLEKNTSKPVHHYYSFDAGVILNSLCELYRMTRDERFISSAWLIGDWLINRMQLSDGSFLSFYDRNLKEIYHELSGFQYDRSSLHTKIAIGLWKLGELTSINIYKEKAKNICDWVVSIQHINGAFPQKQEDSIVYTHTHCYVMEGLLYIYFQTGEEKYLQSVLKASDWLIHCFEKDHGFKKKYLLHATKGCQNDEEYVTDALAQSVRIYCLLYSLIGRTDYLDCSRRALKILQSMQSRNIRDSNAYGGIQSSYRKSYPFNIISSQQTTWSVQFAIQAALFYQECLGKKRFNELIMELF